MDNRKLQDFIQWLMKERGSGLYRSKGVMAIKGSNEKFVFQAVQMMFDGREQGSWKSDEERTCKMVFIGKNLNREELWEKFQACLVK